VLRTGGVRTVGLRMVRPAFSCPVDNFRGGF
jgi:hypothetical protein